MGYHTDPLRSVESLPPDSCLAPRRGKAAPLLITQDNQQPVGEPGCIFAVQVQGGCEFLVSITVVDFVKRQNAAWAIVDRHKLCPKLAIAISQLEIMPVHARSGWERIYGR